MTDQEKTVAEKVPGEHTVIVEWIEEAKRIHILRAGDLVKIPAHQLDYTIDCLMEIYNNLPNVIDGRATRKIEAGEVVSMPTGEYEKLIKEHDISKGRNDGIS